MTAVVDRSRTPNTEIRVLFHSLKSQIYLTFFTKGCHVLWWRKLRGKSLVQKMVGSVSLACLFHSLIKDVIGKLYISYIYSYLDLHILFVLAGAGFRLGLGCFIRGRIHIYISKYIHT